MTDETSSRDKSDERDELNLFATKVGNEINNPLTAVLAAEQYLRARIDADPKLAADERVQRFFGIIETELREATRIVGDLLDFGARRPIARSSFLLRSAVDEAASRVRWPSTITFDNRVAEQMRPVYLDKDNVVLGLAHLLRNAVQAARPSGGRVHVDAEIASDVVTIEVKDDGTGMTAELMSRSLEPLFSSRAKGLGLGLPIADAIARAHGGSLSCDSAPGMGSTFVMRLPLA
ncbi:MAG TPA: HAMP domain-containing sensor histidine kinase [Polyangiaceae bacterium]|nr:HAMP domain-containing sensor histidine kinase [Polyangiaceae bacterium]